MGKYASLKTDTVHKISVATTRRKSAGHKRVRGRCCMGNEKGLFLRIINYGLKQVLFALADNELG